MKTASEIAQAHIPCTCGEIYLSRNLTAPDCSYHSYDWEAAMEEYRNQEPKGTVYVPVKCSERLPEKDGAYFCKSGMSELRTAEMLLWFSVEKKAFTTFIPVYSWLEETTLPIADIAGKAWDSGWQYGHADGAGIMEFTNPQTKEQFIQSLNQ